MNHQKEAQAHAGEIAVKLKSGEYFREARAWYDAKYHAPMADRSWLIVITGFAVLAILVALLAWNLYLPYRPKVPFTIQVTDATHTQTSIHRMAESPYEDKNRALMRYMISRYIEVREGYSAERIDTQFAQIRSMSSREAFRMFYDYVSPTNPESPLVRFQKVASRAVEVEDVAFPEEAPAGELRQVKVTFLATVTTSETQETTRWIATLAFRFKDIMVDQETGAFSPFLFEVTEYSAEPYRSK